ncbi:MAG: NAD(P)-binding domain-containing protein [Bacteroidetes bacterium]|jgi:thioredoxin reductase|nr:NAD(P)-binding domain-containing protein [Bacteroidota bacterium]MDF1863320.1 NAD(P)-binding domain-containing protein [Saprospiraceae bacterium]
MLLEQIIIYVSVLLFCVAIVYFYLKKLKQASEVVEAKIESAKEDGLHEPVSLHPVIDLGTCIKSGACVEACPEKDILGILKGAGTLIKASNCVGHGACFHACPVEAISLVIGTEKRGVDLPHVSESYETNMPGIYIAGELGGMGLIKNSVEQGMYAVENIVKSKLPKDDSTLDIVIVGAGPAGISASLAAKKYGLKFITLEQDTLGGTVYTFPRSKIVMTSPMDLPLYGKVKLFNTSKGELLDVWNAALSKNDITINEKTKVETVIPENGHFKVTTIKGEEFKTKTVLLAIGRRGTPRKLGVQGEMTEKVAYRLLEPEMIADKEIVVVGGGDSAIESAILLCKQNKVVLSYRKDKFSRLKPKNREQILAAIEKGWVNVKYNTNLTKIEKQQVTLKYSEDGREEHLKNDLVYIFAGGELPTQFLQKAGVQITKRFGFTMKKYR